MCGLVSQEAVRTRHQHDGEVRVQHRAQHCIGDGGARGDRRGAEPRHGVGALSRREQSARKIDVAERGGSRESGGVHHGISSPGAALLVLDDNRALEGDALQRREQGADLGLARHDLGGPTEDESERRSCNMTWRGAPLRHLAKEDELAQHRLLRNRERLSHELGRRLRDGLRRRRLGAHALGHREQTLHRGRG